MVKRFSLATLFVALMFGLTMGTAFADPPASDHDGDAGSEEAVFTEDNDNDPGAHGNQPNCPDPDGDADNQHPSGKDRSCEHGKSGNQGKSESTPDQDGKGPERDTNGTDKPNGPGGSDVYDQDGNNGCGNDDDFDDDNEGHCGGKRSEPPNEPPSEENPPEEETQVLGDQLAAPTTSVLGVKLVAGAALPRTGINLVPSLILALSLITSGSVMVRIRRKPTE